MWMVILPLVETPYNGCIIMFNGSGRDFQYLKNMVRILMFSQGGV